MFLLKEIKDRSLSILYKLQIVIKVRAIDQNNPNIMLLHFIGLHLERQVIFKGTAKKTSDKNYSDLRILAQDPLIVKLLQLYQIKAK